MHALITADTLGGVWTYARELVTGLVRRGVRVTLVSFGEIPTARQSAWMEELPELDFRPTAFHLEWMQDAKDDVHASSEYLCSLIDEVKPDLLHLNQYCYGDLPVVVPRVVVAHSDVVSWWVAVHGEEPRESEWIRWYREIVTRGLSHATAVVAPSQWMMDVVKTYYTRPAKSRVIHNGRSANLFNPHVTKAEGVLTVGRIWDSGKQISMLLEHELPVLAYIAGSELHPDSSIRQHGQRRIDTNEVRFMGFQTEAQLRHLYSRATMYAATSRYEPFGLAPLEAALSRCAIIANDIPTFREIWGDAAYYFRRNDSQSLASAIRHLASNSESRISYANMAYDRARHTLNADQMVDGYLELYRTLISAEATAA